MFKKGETWLRCIPTVSWWFTNLFQCVQQGSAWVRAGEHWDQDTSAELSWVRCHVEQMSPLLLSFALPKCARQTLPLEWLKWLCDLQMAVFDILLFTSMLRKSSKTAPCLKSISNLVRWCDNNKSFQPPVDSLIFHCCWRHQESRLFSSAHGLQIIVCLDTTKTLKIWRASHKLWAMTRRKHLETTMGQAESVPTMQRLENTKMQTLEMQTKNGQVTWHASGGEMTKGTRTATEAAACIMSVCQLVFSERRSSNGGKVDDKGSQSFLSQVPILTQCLFDTNVVASMKEQWHNC